MEKVYTVKEAASIMKLSEMTVRRLLNEGWIPFIQHGKKGAIRIREQDIQQYYEYMAAGVVPPTVKKK